MMASDLDFSAELGGGPNDMVMMVGGFGGPPTKHATASANRTTFPRRNAPAFSYPTAVSSARVGSRASLSKAAGLGANSPVAKLSPPYIQAGIDWQQPSSASSGSSSLYNSDDFASPLVSSHSSTFNALEYVSTQQQQSAAAALGNDPYAPADCVSPTDCVSPASLSLTKHPPLQGSSGFDQYAWPNGTAGVSSFSESDTNTGYTKFQDDTMAEQQQQQQQQLAGVDVVKEKGGNKGGRAAAVDAGGSNNGGGGGSRPKRAKKSHVQDNNTVPGSGTLPSPALPLAPASNTRSSSNKTTTTNNNVTAPVVVNDRPSGAYYKHGNNNSNNKNNKSKLRSAARTGKTNHQQQPLPDETAEERRSRNSHNLVEKQYRNRLNAHFESLLNALPDTMRSPTMGAGGGGTGGSGGSAADMMDLGEERRLSKAEVLDMSRRYIQSLERDRDRLEREREELLGKVDKLRATYKKRVASGGGGVGEEGEDEWMFTTPGVAR
ncbi:hypothetical protein QBC46DRAFT_158623 [Diplogelasinospora grovesii]|uniref:BHLH domain-containing protein n=1 Tax=Diplogelasinospora grovesii TaxID=303347 RepID=A0AAN6NF75_9PEZI|nr:hypothetical protein QBC46DRAFT_158623 [Diplogelasinospora grovesii]